MLPEFSFWAWLCIGFALLALELLASFTFFLWLGTSALVTALVLFLFPETTWQVQFLIFSILSVISIILSRRFLVNQQSKSEVPKLNRRAEQYIGRIFTLSENIEQGEGKIKVDDTYWKVSGPRLEKGTEVRVTGAEGAVFTVEAVE